MQFHVNVLISIKFIRINLYIKYHLYNIKLNQYYDIHVSLGKKIKKARNEANMSQEALAREIGITLNSMYRIEKDKMSPTFPIVAKLAEVLDISLDSLR